MSSPKISKKPGKPESTEAPGSAAPKPSLPFPLPPTFPPGVDPETYEIAKVERLLKSAAYFPIFNVANPNDPNKPVPLIPGIPFLLQYFMTPFEVNKSL